MPNNGIETVNSKKIERLLLANENNEELTEELFSFGELLLDEVQQRTAQLDTKLISLLGWTAAILAFLLVGDASWLELAHKTVVTTIFMLLATLSSIGAVCCSFLGVKTAVFQFSSEADWFQTSLFDDVLRLKKFHLISMLETHQAHNLVNVRKGQRAHEAEMLLAASALLIGMATLTKLYPHLCALFS